MSAQDRTLDQYHEYMQINSVAHLMRAARELGLMKELAGGQRTIEQLVQALLLKPQPARLLLDSLVAIGIVEKYDDDYALSRAAQLLSQYDEDLGDSRWSRLVDCVKGQVTEPGNESFHATTMATQWVHTKSAMQAAEILNIGGEGEVAGPKIIDLGCGSAVWSCALAHPDPEATIVAVDHDQALQAARTMADSIGLSDRFEALAGDPLTMDLPESEFDIVLLAQRLFALKPDDAQRQLSRAVSAAKPGGRIVVIDLFRSPGKSNLAERVEALRRGIETESGDTPDLKAAQHDFVKAGLTGIQFTFLAASRVNLGLMVGIRPEG